MVVLVARGQRLVLWGVEVGGERLTAELFYADVYLPHAIKVSSRTGDRIYQVEIPEELQGQKFPKKGQRLTLKLKD